jgi:hypothetical protein
MNVTLNLFLLVLALVLLLLAGLGVPDQPRLRLGWLGAFFALLSMVLK